MFICGGVVYLALHHTTAANATLIYTASNVMILIFEWLFRGRTIGRREIFGTALAIAGVAVVALGAEGWRLTLNPGDVLIGARRHGLGDLLGAPEAAVAHENSRDTCCSPPSC